MAGATRGALRTRSLHARNSDFHNGCSAPLPQPSSPSADLSSLPAPTWTDNTRVSPSFKMNALLVYSALVVDVFVAAYADITYGSTSQVDVMATIFQICSFFLTVMCLYNMMSETQLVKRAMFFKLADEFAPAVFLTFLYFVFILATRFYRLGLVYQNYPHLQIWNESAFTGLYIFTKIVQVMYYSTVVWSMQKLLASPELFRSSQSSFHSVYPANN